MATLAERIDSSEAFEIVPLQRTISAEIQRVDMSRPLTPALKAAIHAAHMR
jgi:hypothetical protein